jgi:hypothetical protein
LTSSLLATSSWPFWICPVGFRAVYSNMGIRRIS